MSLELVKTRQDAFDFLEGYAEQRKEELDQKRTRLPLVKSYMLETLPSHRTQPDMVEVFRRAGCRLTPLDEILSTVYSLREKKTIGLLEMLFPRHPVVYTQEQSAPMDKWVRSLVLSTPELDNVWLSGLAFQQLWDAVLRFTPGHRYGRLVFQHDSLFSPEEGWHADGDADGDVVDEADFEHAETDQPNPYSDEDAYVHERRTTRFMVVDRLSVLEGKLGPMRALYHPLYSISQLRFPARGAGGHDFYFTGKVTNRSSSFADHRQHLQFVLKVYREATDRTEREAWTSVEQGRTGAVKLGPPMVGAPVVLRFSEPLPQPTFDRFIESTFHRARSRFRLWGNPLVLGPRKVHVYGADRHLWQPLFLEITDHQIVVILPRGTCGNTVHRLVANVQQYLDPKVEVSVGGRSYAELVKVGPEAGSVYDD